MLNDIKIKILNIKFFAFIPIIFVFIFLYFKMENIKKREENIKRIYEKGKETITIRSLKKNFIFKYKNSKDPYFMDKYLKDYIFKKKEIERLKKLVSHPAFSFNKNLKKRLNFLQNENKLSFKEVNIEANSFLKEIEEKQKRQIEENETDIKKLLSFFENRSIDKYVHFKNSSHMIIKRFSIIKRKNGLILDNLTVIKREFYEN